MEENSLRPAAGVPADSPAVDSASVDWRSQLQPDARQRIVNEMQSVAMEENSLQPAADVPSDSPAIDSASVDWRSQLQPDARQRIVNEIMNTLKRHVPMPIPVPEGLSELKKIAVRFEEKIYTTATNEIHTKKRNRLDSKRLRDLVYVQFNLRIKTKLSSKSKDGKDRDILLARDARNATAWVVDNYNSEDEDSDDLYLGTDIPLRVVSQAAGADEILQPGSRYYTRRGQYSTSAGSSRAATQALEEPLDFEEEEETNSEEDNIQLEDSDSDDDILKDEIFMLGADSDDN